MVFKKVILRLQDRLKPAPLLLHLVTIFRFFVSRFHHLNRSTFIYRASNEIAMTFFAN